MFTRKIEIVLCEEFVDVHKGLPNKQISDAIGYLANWAIGSERYHSVRIVGDQHGDLTAVYSNKNGETTYVIGAVQHTDGEGFSFHS